jgi:hypothetical protein
MSEASLMVHALWVHIEVKWLMIKIHLTRSHSHLLNYSRELKNPEFLEFIFELTVTIKYEQWKLTDQ